MRGRIGTPMNGKRIKVRRGGPSLKEILARADREHARYEREKTRQERQEQQKLYWAAQKPRLAAEKKAAKEARMQARHEAQRGKVEFGPYLTKKQRKTIEDRAVVQRRHEHRRRLREQSQDQPAAKRKPVRTFAVEVKNKSTRRPLHK